MYALINCTIYTNESILEQHAVVIDNTLIESIIPIEELDLTMEKIDLEGANLSPGFIDLQLNGCGGVMFNGAETIETLATMQSTNLKSGTTSFLPTFITDSNQGMKKAISATKEYIEQTSNEVLGLHLEGPYISTVKKGVHRQKFVRQPDPTMINLICDNSDVITKITIAPEEVPMAMIKQLHNADIIVSLGHSNATYQQATEAIKHGASFATHLFNAMTSITGREPGVVGAVYDNDIYAGIIVDGFHVAYENVRLSKKMLGEKLILVTDATAAASSDIEQFDFVGTTVYYKEGKCSGADGTLGGSAVTMIESIQQCVDFVAIQLDEAIRMATLYPAKAISVDHKLGSIKPGKVANLAIFDNSYRVKGTVVNGAYQEQT